MLSFPRVVRTGSVHEIGNSLHLPPERISDEKYKAIRKLRAHLADEA